MREKVDSAVRSFSFRSSCFTIGIVSKMFDPVYFRTKLLNYLGKLFHVLVAGAGSDGDCLLL